MSNTDERHYRQTLALAGVFQAVHFVKKTAWKGRHKAEGSHALLNSLFQIDADTVEQVYGDVNDLQVGMRVLREQLGGNASERDMEVARYAAQLLTLQRKLMRNNSVLQSISSEIANASTQREQFGIDHVNTTMRLADIYSDHISKLSPRIMVKGDPTHLGDNNTAANIRAFLLAGIRSAFLWRQSGGTRWLLLFKRSQYLQCVDSLLNEGK